MSATNTHTHTAHMGEPGEVNGGEDAEAAAAQGRGGCRGLGVLQMEADTEAGNCETAWAIALWLFS